LTPGKRLILGFASIIVMGTFLLWLPISHQPGKEISLIDSFFTSTSAVCVTGLSTIDVGNTLSFFGDFVLGTLIQLGGIGFASFALFFLMLIGGNRSYSNIQLAREALNSKPGFDINSIVRTVIATSLVCESIGALLSYQVFSKDYLPMKALGISIFHAISAFNNAGFDLLGNFTGLIPYRHSVLLNITTTTLIIIGGLGFYVINDIFAYRKNHRLKMHSKIVLTMTFWLLVLGTIGFHFSQHIPWMEAFFQSTTTRTAGFSTIDISQLTNTSSMLTMLLMFVGASPGSTGGGIKTTTLFTVLLSIRKIETHSKISAFHRTIDDDSILRAFMVTVLGILFTLLATAIVFSVEGPRFNFLEVLFECISAFGTVGLSMGITTRLGICSKLTLILLMFIGRLGPLTITCSWHRARKNVNYLTEDILIG
jgi:trk system potassium uptake protein TrkH